MRRHSFDEAIVDTVPTDYVLPLRFAPDDVVLDIGCHIGAFALRAARRGAKVIGFEASRENYALARMNTSAVPGVDIRWAAVWRSDIGVETLRATPHPDRDNTGGVSVLFPDEAAHHAFFGLRPGSDAPRPAGWPTSHSVQAIPLDRILCELGSVRLLKIDVEGAELPILATSRELERVEEIVGELHQMTARQIDSLPAAARVGGDGDARRRLCTALAASGFTVHFVSGTESCFAARRF